MRTYKKPMITVDSGLAEGVYAASGSSQGILNVTYHAWCMGSLGHKRR